MLSGLAILTLIALAFILGAAFGNDSGSSKANLRYLEGYSDAEKKFRQVHDARGRFVKR